MNLFMRHSQQRVKSAAHPRQTGVTLIEALVGLAIGLMVIAAMIAVMFNTFGTGAKSIGLTSLQQELRMTMQMITRDLRRASYNMEAIQCFGVSTCGANSGDPMYGKLAADITINTDGNNDCLIYEWDRSADGDATNNNNGGFRLRTSNGRGRIEMWLGTGDTTCASTSDRWIAITNDEVVDIDTFVICADIVTTDAQCDRLLPGGGVDYSQPEILSYSTLIDVDAAGNEVRQRVRRVWIMLGGHLVRDSTFQRWETEVVRVRNDFMVY